MDNSERVKLLSELRERLDTKSKSGQDGELDIQGIFRSFLSDLGEGSKKQSSHQHKVVAILELLLKSMKTHPEWFLGGDNPDGSKENYFSIWIIHRLVTLLGTPSYFSLHKKSIQAVHSLTMLLKYKQQKLYISVVGILVSLLRDVHNVIVQMFLKKTLPTMALPISLGQFQAEHSGSLTDDPNILIRKETDAWALLANLSEVMCLLLEDICQAFSWYYTKLWAIFCSQALWNNSSLQEVSLRCIGILLTWRTIAVEAIIDDAFNIIITCLQAIPVRGNDMTMQHEHVDPTFQKALAFVISSALKARKFVPPAHVGALTGAIYNINCNYDAVVNTDLKMAIAEIMCTVCSQGKCNNLIHHVTTIRACGLKWINLIGCHDNFQYMAKCLSELIVYDLFKSNLQNVNTTKKPKMENIETSKENLKLERFPTGADKDRRNSIFHHLNSRFSFLLGILKEQTISKEVCCSLDGVVLMLRTLAFIITKQDELKEHLVTITEDISRNIVEMEPTIAKILDNLFNYLRTTNVDNEIVRQLFLELLNLTKILLFYHNYVPLPPDLLHVLICIVSLPWITRMDTEFAGVLPCLKGRNVAEMKHLAETVSGNIAFKDCYELIVMFPSPLWTKWSLNIFKISTLENFGEIQETAMEFLSVLVAKLQENERDEVLAILKSTNKDVLQNYLSKCFGNLACALCGYAFLKNTIDIETFPMTVKPFSCTSCDKHVEPKPDSANLTCSKYDAFFREVLDMILPGASSRVKLSFVMSFKRLSNHINLSDDYCSQVLSGCIDLIEDPDYDVRMKFSKILPYLTKQNVNATKTIVAKVKEVFTKKVSSKKKIRLQETIVYTIGELGKEARDDLLLVVIISLLETLLTGRKLTSSIAFTQIRAVAKYRKKSMQELFVDLKFHICKFMVDTVVKQQQEATSEENDTCLNVFTKICRVFDFKSVKALMQSAQSIVVPQLVRKAAAQSSVVLRQLAKHLRVNYRKDLLLLNFNFIFSHLVRTCSGEELKEALAFVERETDVDLGSLLRSDSQSVVNQLLLHLKSSYNKVFTGLCILANKDDTRTGVKNITNSEQMAEFLHPRLLGILAFFNTVLLDDKNVEEKYLALGSLVKLMEMMGPKHITVVRVKVMAILRLALQFETADFHDLCCQAWECFVRSLDVPSLRSMLGHIVVTLIPLLDHSVEKIAAIFHYLIVENESVLKDSFRDVYCVPDYPQLATVNKVLRAVTRNNSSFDVRVEINQIMKGVAHESKDVRHHAVSRLRTLLHDHQSELHEYITNKDEIDPVITNLINTLIGRCGEPVRSTQLKVGECLGELGAIDPGWLDKHVQTLSEEPTVFEMKCDSPGFAVELLNELVRAFLAAADTRSQDCSAYAIQEVLQIYECASKATTSVGHKIWCELPDHIQEVLKPHLHSKYVHSAQSNRGKLTKPIYCSINGKNFCDWISTWTLELVAKVKNRKAFRLFKACSAVFKHNINTAIFLLPHIMLYVAIDGNTQEHQEVYDEILAILKHVKEKHDTSGRSLANGVTDFSHISAQTIFSFLDYLTRWARLKADSTCKTQILTSRAERANQNSSDNSRDDGLAKVLQFLEGIPQNTLASASFRCEAYARSLMHFEQFIERSQEDLQTHLNSIQQLYWALNEPDGVVGVAAVRNCAPSLYEEILEHKSEGKLRDAVACYERAIQLEPDRIDNHKGLMDCWIVLGQVSTALEHANGVLTRRPGWTNSMNSYRVEACWRLGHWDALESYAKLENSCSDWSTGVGKVLLAAKKKDKEEFSKCIFELRNTQMEPLSAASMESGSYQRGYDFIVRLHILHELEDCLSNIFLSDNHVEERLDVNVMLSNWNKRLSVTRASFQAREPILSIRRIMLKLLSSDQSAANIEDHCWLQSAKVARKAGHFQTAYSHLLNVRSLCSTTECCLEQSKLLWAQGNCHQALLRLEKWLAESKSVADGSPMTKAKTLFFVARWMEETANYGPPAILAQYKEVVLLNGEWENAHFYLAKYYDKLINSVTDIKKTGSLDFLPFVMKHYGDSLQYGNKFIYQSIPKILQFWLDFGANVQDQGKQAKSGAMQQRLAALNSIMNDLTERLPAYQFFTAFSQLISRICHQNEEVWEQLKKLIAKLLVTYPQQAIWLILAVSKSTLSLRKSRCQQIFQIARRADRKIGKFVEDACKLAQLLIEVSEKNRGKENVLSMSQDFGVLKRLVSEDQFSSIIIPLQSSLTVALPSGHRMNKEHYPFPDSQPTFVGFEDKVEVLQSLARPKKVAVKGSDGQTYILLCKPKDDLRKDGRLMEFNGLINKCLRKDPECRRRQLHIRTYVVIPLNEECGLLEWVPNTCGLRNILTKLYKEKGVIVRNTELKRLYDSMRAAKKEERKNIFQSQVLKRFPPIFHEWFLKTFPTPTSWYNSRLAYCHTAAVMSMVGYILGLGDRHGENVLFDSTNGDCVHVDFNCLFNKGETFDCPECVPFRLTHNMIRAMGPLGYEGIFRRSCEVTLKLMRSQHDSLLSVLKTFVYDPLVEWGERRHRDTAGSSVAKEEGIKIVKQIDQRLRGYNSTNKIHLPLSIEGEVHQLITEATDDDNLSLMYIGWAAHL